MIKPSVKQGLLTGESPADTSEPFDASALIDAVRDLEAKLEIVTRREREYRDSMTRLEDEVRAAGALQRALLPVEMPDIRGANCSVLFRPHSEVSGDAYDVFRIDDSRIGFTLADATGHGMPAALLSTMIRRTLRDEPTTRGSKGELDPACVLTRVNNELLALGLDDCQFVAGLYGVFDERTGVIRLARGGAPYPVVLGQDDKVRVIRSDGPILGAMAHPSFEVTEFELTPGERLFISTDGIEPLIDAGADAESAGEAWTRFFADCRAQLPGAGDTSPTGTIFEAIERRISPNHTRHDDITLLALERCGDADKSAGTVHDGT